MPALGAGGREFESRHPDQTSLLRNFAWQARKFAGLPCRSLSEGGYRIAVIISVFQTEDAGSTPATRSILRQGYGWQARILNYVPVAQLDRATPF